MSCTKHVRARQIVVSMASCLRAFVADPSCCDLRWIRARSPQSTARRLAAVARTQSATAPSRSFTRAEGLALTRSRESGRSTSGSATRTPILVGNRVYHVLAPRRQRSAAPRLMPTAGKEIWAHELCRRRSRCNSAAARHEKGPKIDADLRRRLKSYTLGMTGIVTAFNAADRQAAVADGRSARRAALPHGDVAARRSRPGHRARRRPQPGALTAFDPSTPARSNGDGPATVRATARRSSPSSAARARSIVFTQENCRRRRRSHRRAAVEASVLDRRTRRT